MYSQRLFFGKYAEMYFDNSQRERLEKQVNSYKKRSDDIFNGLGEIFTREDVLKKAGISEDAAKQVIYRWVKMGYCKKIVAKKGKGKWQKISQEQKQKS